MTEAVSLAIYEAARVALAECVRVDEVQQVRSDALKMKAYAKIAKDRRLQADAATLVMRAERKLGTLIQSAKEIGQLGIGRKSNLTMSQVAARHVPEDENNGTSGEPLSDDQPIERVTLSEVGVDKKLSAKAQKWARLGDDEFEAKLQAERDRIESIGAAPINGARTVMASRKEPGASLDYFPTPPWATRSLIEDVLDGELFGVVWEPACGEGHISGVLEEYGDSVQSVLATDIHDYSADGRAPPGWEDQFDFLVSDELLDIVTKHTVDWIITNPPFSGDEDRAMAFALKALSIAKSGVALFVRTQWLEGVERYAKLFGPNPPTVIAQFAERVPLVRGRWDPEASTASQYCWVVWIKDVHGSPCGFQWIKPGRRVERTKPDDVERFTTKPVLSIRQDEPAEPVVDGTSAVDDRPEYPSGESGTAREAPGSSAPSDGIAGLSEGQDHSSSGEVAARSADPVLLQDGTQSAPPPPSATSADASTSAPPAAARALEVARSAERAGSIAAHGSQDASPEVAATPETAGSATDGPGAGEGAGEKPGALLALPLEDIPVEQLTRDQQNEIIRAGYTRVPKVTAIELMLLTGLKRSTIEMRAKAMDLTDPLNRLNAVAELNRRRAQESA